MSRLPSAKGRDIIVQTIGRETLIYDLAANRAYNLNETLTLVYQACDGRTSVEALKAEYDLTDDVVFLALDELKRTGLLDDAEFPMHHTAVSRRAAIRRIGLASMIAIPVISSLTAPQAAAAASNCVATGSSFPIPNSGGGTSSCFTTANDARCCSGRVSGAQVDPTTNTIIICTCGAPP